MCARASAWRAWPPRLPDQPIFYPVLNEQYAIMIARDWNVPAHGAGYVTRFEVDRAFAARYPVRQVDGRDILELWGRPRRWPSSTGTSSGSAELTLRWQQRWAGLAAVGRPLRHAFPSRWVRFHSLPGSKRYAGSDYEYGVQLHRHNTVIGELNALGSRLPLVHVPLGRARRSRTAPGRARRPRSQRPRSGSLSRPTSTSGAGRTCS